MDFELTEEQKAHRKEFFEVCNELEKKRPPSFVGFEATYEIDECWEFHLYCARNSLKGDGLP